MRTEPAPTRTPPPAPGQPQRAPTRAKFTDRLFYAWEHLRPAQQDAAWQMIASMRTTMASERRTRRIIGLLVVVALGATAVVVYLLLTAPMR